LTAARDPAVAAVAGWAPISRVHRYPTGEVLEWRRLGYRVQESSRTGQALRTGTGFLEDVEKWSREGDIPVQLYRVGVPVLLVHGNRDTSVPPEESESLAAVGPTVRLVVLAGADHRFGSSHPFAGPSPPLEEALAVTADFFRRCASAAP
jgi:pimeloyl-ACP methyl ester carboxylesterase